MTKPDALERFAGAIKFCGTHPRQARGVRLNEYRAKCKAVECRNSCHPIEEEGTATCPRPALEPTLSLQLGEPHTFRSVCGGGLSTPDARMDPSHAGSVCRRPNAAAGATISERDPSRRAFSPITKGGTPCAGTAASTSRKARCSHHDEVQSDRLLGLAAGEAIPRAGRKPIDPKAFLERGRRGRTGGSIPPTGADGAVCVLRARRVSPLIEERQQGDRHPTRTVLESRGSAHASGSLPALCVESKREQAEHRVVALFRHFAVAWLSQDSLRSGIRADLQPLAITSTNLEKRIATRWRGNSQAPGLAYSYERVRVADYREVN